MISPSSLIIARFTLIVIFLIAFLMTIFLSSLQITYLSIDTLQLKSEFQTRNEEELPIYDKYKCSLKGYEASNMANPELHIERTGTLFVPSRAWQSDLRNVSSSITVDSIGIPPEVDSVFKDSEGFAKAMMVLIIILCVAVGIGFIYSCVAIFCGFDTTRQPMVKRLKLPIYAMTLVALVIAAGTSGLADHVWHTVEKYGKPSGIMVHCEPGLLALVWVLAGIISLANFAACLGGKDDPANVKGLDGHGRPRSQESVELNDLAPDCQHEVVAPPAAANPFRDLSSASDESLPGVANNPASQRPTCLAQESREAPGVSVRAATANRGRSFRRKRRPTVEPAVAGPSYSNRESRQRPLIPVPPADARPLRGILKRRRSSVPPAFECLTSLETLERAGVPPAVEEGPSLEPASEGASLSSEGLRRDDMSSIPSHFDNASQWVTASSADEPRSRRVLNRADHASRQASDERPRPTSTEILQRASTYMQAIDSPLAPLPLQENQRSAGNQLITPPESSQEEAAPPEAADISFPTMQEFLLEEVAAWVPLNRENLERAASLPDDVEDPSPPSLDALESAAVWPGTQTTRERQRMQSEAILRPDIPIDLSPRRLNRMSLEVPEEVVAQSNEIVKRWLPRVDNDNDMLVGVEVLEGQELDLTAIFAGEAGGFGGRLEDI